MIGDGGAYLAVDLGAAKTGIALSEHGMLAHAYGILKEKRLSVLVQQVIDLCGRERVACVVVGVPYSLRGGVSHENERTARVDEFMDRLRQAASGAGLEITVYAHNEQFTSAAAGHFLTKKHQSDDAKAAELLLQQFLDIKNRASNERTI